MRRTPTAARRRAAVVLAIALAVPALLAACTSDPVSARSPSPSPVRTSSVPVPTPTTPPPTQVAADATPLHRDCAALVPDAVAQQLASALAPQAGWTPPARTVAARIVTLHGTACEWTDAAGDVLQVAVAKPSKHDATALKDDLVRRSNSVPTYGGEAYFEVADHQGRVDAFRGRVWISAVSNRFFEPGDAVAVVQSIDAALGTTPRSATTSPSPSVRSTATSSASPSTTP